jgi:predicted alpha/beta hydrolase family esterase
VGVVDTPSDMPEGMDDSFRTSKEQLLDVTKAVEYLSSKGCTSIYLVGISRGTISVAYLGAEMKNDRIKGIVLTSTMKYSEFLRRIPIEKTPYPVLIVHNSDDKCKVTPYVEANLLPEKFNSSPKATFESVSGGGHPKSDP